MNSLIVSLGQTAVDTQATGSSQISVTHIQTRSISYEQAREGLLSSPGIVVVMPRSEEVIFSELSPRPHDTGMVTLVSQNLTEFDLHARAVLGLPVPAELRARPSASAVILADRDSEALSYEGLADALSEPGTDLRIFAKPTSRPFRRMGVTLATAGDTDEARRKARDAAHKVKIVYGD